MSSHYGGSHFASSHFLSSHYGRTGITPPPFTPEPVYPPGTRRISDVQRRIMEEEELILLVIRAWLSLKDRE
ncbi:MAG: hypothetical protein AMJ84_00350 [Acidithiobacillales bacterium SM23_46]|nr:MAG: hypothetical protein AMJ84_00350 [Acidithiobacillales bacterium SM23_46]